MARPRRRVAFALSSSKHAEVSLPVANETRRLNNRRLPGPGAERVGRWVGRLGVASLPAAAVGLGLQERVVRRHAARLQEAAWLDRATGAWGGGSVLWLTPRGMLAVGLGGLQPVTARSAPSPTLIAHAVRVSWSAAQAQQHDRLWRSARELALERERWEVKTRGERGWTTMLPDLTEWAVASQPPAAVVIETAHRRASRQRAILEGWRDAIRTGRYATVRYDCASEETATRITRLAEEVDLGQPIFHATAQKSPAEVAAIKPPRQHQHELVASSPAAAANRQAGPTAAQDLFAREQEPAIGPLPKAAQAVERAPNLTKAQGLNRLQRRRRWHSGR